LKLAPSFHSKKYLGGIGSLSATGKTEEEATPVTPTVIQGQPPGDHIFPKKVLAGKKIKVILQDTIKKTKKN